MINYFLILFIGYITLAPASSFKKPSFKSAYFTLVRAEKIPWKSGAPDGKGGAGISYNVILTFKKDFVGYFNIIWIGRHYYTVKVMKNEAIPNLNSFKAGETITIQATEFTNYPIGEKPLIKNNTDPPFEYTGAALLEYVSGSTTHCFTIKNFVDGKPSLGI